MTYVITAPCVGVKDGSCVDVCPVECIHSRPEEDMYFIDPDECIDCGVCVPECPVDAIYPEEEVPDKYRHFTLLNAAFFGRGDDGSSGAPVPRRGPFPILPGSTEAPIDDGENREEEH